MVNRRNVFSRVQGLVPSRSVFDLSYQKIFDCDMGQLIPIMCDEVVPGDIIKFGNQSVIRFQPLVAPILHEVNQYVHYWFVPNRLLWNREVNEILNDEAEEDLYSGSWEGFITGGDDGANADVLPTWNPTTYTVGSLWDYVGFPPSKVPTGALPVDFPRRAYNFIWNEWYRDENLQDKVSLLNEDILNRNWEKDYYTSSLLNQQKGVAPALPISGTSFAEWQTSDFDTSAEAGFIALQFNNTNPNTIAHLPNGTTNAVPNAEAFFNNNSVDLSSATTFDIADLRLAFQMQKWLERNNRCGSRYVEFLKAHFGIAPQDSRLQRPEYIGGSKTPIIISEVLQTSSTDVTSPQGNLAGHGIAVSNAYCGTYRVQEFGLIIGLMSVMPRSVYQDGINRQWLKSTKYDYYFREFANLSEQAVTKVELYVTNGDATTNNTIFGYQGRYNELRTKQNMICGQMRTTFDYWHMSRQFGAAPTLNDTFVKCVPRKDIFAAESEPGMLVSFGNLIKAIRPLPFAADPGLIDHN